MHSFQQKNSRSPQPSHLFSRRSFEDSLQMKTKAQQSPEELENEAFAQNKFEAFGLQLKEKSGTITPIEKEQLSLLQAKMTDFWEQRQEKASRSGFDFSKVSVSPRESVAPQLQLMWQQETPEVSLEDQAMSNMEKRANEFYKAKSKIIKPCNEGENSNCHGYTVTGNSGTFLTAAGLLEQIGNKKIIVFVKDGEIAHSALPHNDDTFSHLLIGVGIVKTPAEYVFKPQELGYKDCFFLPDHVGPLNQYLQKHNNLENE